MRERERELDTYCIENKDYVPDLVQKCLNTGCCINVIKPESIQRFRLFVYSG